MTRTNGRPRLLIIGLDGGTWDVLQPLMARGHMPTLAQLVKEGASGVLRSTFPPITAPAWTSFMTGKYPGKHGIFSFLGPLRNPEGRLPLNRSHVVGDSLWHILSHHNKTVGVINVPFTWPAEPVRGILITGMDTPHADEKMLWPHDLWPKFQRILGDYPIDVLNVLTGAEWNGGLSPDQILARQEAITEMRLRAAIFVHERLDWDVLMVMFEQPDRIQHRFWNYFDPTHPCYTAEDGARYGEAVVASYRFLDAQIGRLLTLTDDHTMVAIVSDHGFCAALEHFHVNNFLAERDLFALLDDAPVSPARAAEGPAWRNPVRSYDHIDWSRTRAFSGIPADGGIFINLKGREPFGLVEPGAEYEALRDWLIDELSQIRYPGTDMPFLKRPLRREELYSGPFVDQAPDIMLPSQGLGIIPGERWSAEGQLLSPITHPGGVGHHHIEGIWLLRGPGIEPGLHVEGAVIPDMAPTLLYALGLPIPDDMDGRVLTPAFRGDYLRRQGTQFTPAAPALAGELGGYSAEEAKEVERRLRGLGYLE